jgi:O-antigen ligase
MRSAALRVIQIGAIAIVLVASTLTVFDLDRFIVPKELVLHLTALLAALFAFGAIRQLQFVRADWFLIIFLLLSAVSAATGTNRWVGFRAFAVSVSAVLLFWTAKALGDSRIITALAIAVVISSLTSLLEAYGLRTELFAATRVPGGTLGNRNFIAHVAAFGLPLLFYLALRTRFLLASMGVAIVAASLVLTRSRGAWLAAAVMLIVFALFSRAWTRIAGVLAFAAIGAAAALLIPNTLKWRAENPYLESVRGVANYEEGSGRGRLQQYSRSLVMAGNHPLLGVGPGNWPVVYPRFAARNDPSIGGDNMTFNPWPSSDWVAFISERGLATTVFLLLALASIAFSSRDPAVLAIIAAAVVAGLFDAVLLLPVPAFIVFTALGALTGAQAIVPVQPGRLAWPPIVILILIAAAATFRSGAQLVAMTMVDEPRQAAAIDPGNFRVQMRLASKCDHARAAHDLFPYAASARAAARRCGR